MAMKSERIHVKCRSCGAYLGATLNLEPTDEWKCSLCFTVTYGAAVGLPTAAERARLARERRQRARQ